MLVERRGASAGGPGRRTASPTSLQRRDDPAQPLRLRVRLAVDRQRRAYGALERRRCASRASGAKIRAASAITSPTTSTPAGDAFGARAARPSARPGRGAAPRRGRPRSGSAPPASTGRSSAGRPRRARPARPRRRASAPASVEFVSPKTSTQSGRSRSSASRIPAASPPGRRCAGRAGSAGSGSPSSSKKTCRQLGVPVLPRVEDDLLDPRVAQRLETGADLMNCGRLPTTVRTFTAARLSPRRGAHA